MSRAGGRLSSGAMSEAAFQASVIGLAAFYGWRHYHPPDNRPAAQRGRAGRQRVTPGYPDLTLVRGPELIFAELKAEAGVVSAAQREWLAALEEVAKAVRAADEVCESEGIGPPLVAVEVHIWRPSDWDELSERLARGRQRVEHPLGP